MSDRQQMMLRITGYASKMSVSPGEEITFHIHSEFNESYQADIVRPVLLIQRQYQQQSGRNQLCELCIQSAELCLQRPTDDQGWKNVFNVESDHLS